MVSDLERRVSEHAGALRKRLGEGAVAEARERADYAEKVGDKQQKLFWLAVAEKIFRSQ